MRAELEPLGFAVRWVPLADVEAYRRSLQRFVYTSGGVGTYNHIDMLVFTRNAGIEGMAQGDRLHPLQRKFLEHAALQCGICTPGFIVEDTLYAGGLDLKDLKKAVAIARKSAKPKNFIPPQPEGI